ncbi:hypothetical protein DBV15_09209 [Temnothorax longispinosus]|uniref:Uncharacterized protein n=1 Tax=Temnothorax longispinosus TaxID=300112 RepID=A0A4S2KFC6_9HYME|nr:hypothetical protein DBV15_09209 [Temnothorax longispinosus]
MKNLHIVLTTAMKHNKYDHTKSTTYISQNDPFPQGSRFPLLLTASTFVLPSTSCTMDQNLARLQNPHRFLRENRFLEGEDPGCYSWRVIPARRPGHPKHQSGNPCANRDQERDGSGNLFVLKLDPPSGFSDAFELRSRLQQSTKRP